MKLSKRLESITNYVIDGASILDIGSEHALLDIYLYKNKKLKKIVVTDINKKPLEIGISNIKKYNLDGKIESRLGNGLDTLTDDIDTIIITGLGGITIKNILDIKRLRNVRSIILSVNNDFELVRSHLLKNGFKIDRDEIIKDHGKYYMNISFSLGYDKASSLFGRLMFTDDEKEYFKKEIKECEKVLLLMPRKYMIKRLKIKIRLKQIKNSLLF